jgi:arylsulfatase A-like enzyme
MHPSHGHDMTIINGISRIGYMSGGRSARWKDEDMSDDFARAAVRFIEKHRQQPFFLYFTPHDIHVPRVPHPRFVGRTPHGPRGDVMVELDECVGQVLAALDRLGLAQDTLVIFSSDNGPVVDDGYRDEAVARLGWHRPAGPWRGGKYSRFEGGTRVPMLVRWPARIKPGVSDALVCHVDFTATFAALLKQEFPAGTWVDAVPQVEALHGESAVGRDHLVEQAGGLALREGRWKFMPGGPGPKRSEPTNTELGNDTGPQLYDLEADPGETTNLASAQPDRVQAMRQRLEQIRSRGTK